MLEIKHPFSIWLQISSFSFFCAGNFSDLLIIRLCLSSAYVFLFLNSALGAPLWPLWDLPHELQLDGVLWAILNLYVHLTTVFRLLRDELPVTLENEDMEALWRMFYRTGGLSKLLFQKNIAEYCTCVTHEQGDSLSPETYFYIIYKGTVKLTVTDDNGAIVSSRQAQSGQLFDFRALGLLEDHLSLEKHKLEAVVAVSSVELFRFPRDQMEDIANNPRTRLMWKELLMESLLRIVQRYIDKRVRMSPDYVNPIFAPLAPWEEPDPLRAGSGKALQTPLLHVFASAMWSFAPPWPFKGPPVGLRHSQLVAPGRVQNIPPKRLLDATESKTFHGASSMASMEVSSLSANNDTKSYQSMDISGEDESMIDSVYGLTIDEEMGGMDLVRFKRAVSSVSKT